jgi:histone deacetylase 6
MDQVGYVYDDRLLLHSEARNKNSARNTFPEFPERIRAIHSNLESKNILRYLTPLEINPVSASLVSQVHQPSLVEKLLDLKYDYSDMMNPKPRGPGVKYTMNRQLYDNEFTSDCIFLSAGGAVKAVDSVWKGEVSSAFANIRPPGHHAKVSEVGGFCYVNNVAIAARHAQQLGARKIAIFDWDVHHGNGTQDIFKNDPDVLFISAHRYDLSKFYPYSRDSSSMFIGQGEGRGFNLNIAWDTEEAGQVSQIGDGDYKLAFDSVVQPVLKEFRPDLVIVSAGFDAMAGDPVGNLSLTPDIYAYMSYQLKKQFKTVLALEGGYNLETMQTASFACIRALLRKDVDFGNFNPKSTPMGKDSISNIVEVGRDYWDIENYSINNQ